jgi:hypothetical protein
MQKNIKNNTFFCFSPPVMLATFILEFSLALYAVYRYHLNEVGKLIVAALVSLGIFQIAEYFVCGGYGLSGNTWSRIGYVAITALPVLGFHMMLAINKSSSNKILMFAYGSMAAFMAYFLLASTAFTGYQCTGNYVIFQIGQTPAIVYGMFYYGWLLAALVLGVKYLTSKIKQLKEIRNMTKALMIGYGVFLIPTALAYTVNPATRSGIPSIMCGFAVLFALILAFYILPLAGTKKNASEQASLKTK